MKNKFLVSLLLFAGILSGCSATTGTLIPPSSTDSQLVETQAETQEVSKTIGNDIALLAGNAYCDSYSKLHFFWDDYYSPTYKAMMDEDGNDIPVMRLLGKKYTELLVIDNSKKFIQDFEKNQYSTYFKDTIRLLTLSQGYLEDFFKGSANLIDFNDFKENVAPKMLAFNQAIAKVTPTFKGEFEEFAKSVKQEPVSELLLNLDELCKTLATEEWLDETQQPTQEVPESFIKINNGSGTIQRSSNKAFNIYGKTSSNCEKIIVKAQNETAGIYDEYQLTAYNKGDTSFKYGIREDWDNLGEGKNQYTFSAYCDGDQVNTAKYELTIGQSKPIYENTTYSTNSTLSNDNYYTNTDGQKVLSPTNYKPAGASAKCNDGTYSSSQHRSGTCSGHGGVATWL
jgi:hypothetical protein